VIALAMLLPGCGGGHRGNPSSRTAGGGPSASTPGASPAAAAPPAVTPPAAAYWSYAKVINRLAGQTLVLPHGRVRLDGTLLECNGEGTPLLSGQARRWSRYTCTQTLFQAGADQDVTFDVAIWNASALRIISPRYGS
jgi:hypothetical protein